MPLHASQLARQGLGLAFKVAEAGLRLALAGAERAVRHVTGADGSAPEEPEVTDPLAFPARDRAHPAGEPARPPVAPVPRERTEATAAEHTAAATTQADGEATAAPVVEPAAEGPEPPAPEAEAPEPAAPTGPPTAAEAVAAELAEEPAWRAADTAPAPPAEEEVDEGTALAGESSDPGAEEGAGAEVRVEPPWPGYDRLRARDIVDRLTAADPELASAVRLYEARTKARKTVLEAAARAERR